MKEECKIEHKTFYDWCIETNHENLLNLWDDCNIFSPKDVSYMSKKEVYIKCERGLHDSRYVSIQSIVNSKKCLCKQCNSFAQYGIDKYGNGFLERYWDYDMNKDIDPWKIDFSSRKYVYLKCQKELSHGSYAIMCNTFINLNSGSGCPFCTIRGKNGKPKREDSLGVLYPKSILFWSDINSLSVFEVTPKSHKKVWWKCDNNLHDEYIRSISETVRYDFRCPACSTENKFSILQMKVSQFVKELGYNLKHEYDCNIAPVCKSGYNNIKLPYDNEIPELKLIIEVHGKQHYTKCSWHTLSAKRNNTSVDEEFIKQQERDLYKQEYAINKGYNYLIIPYYEEENDKYKQIILDKINEINKNI